MTDSILTTVKAGLGIAEDDTSFDTELKIHINACFQPLRQLGVGPSDGFLVLTAEESWTDYLGAPMMKMLTAVQTYVILKTKLNFDPPDMGFVVTSMERQLETLEGRMLIDTDKPPVKVEEVTEVL